MQALQSHTSQARWLRYARIHLRHRFPYLPKQPGFNKRLRKLADTLNWLVGVLAGDTSLWSDDVWVVDSTPVECARSPRPAGQAVHRSDLAGWAQYGYCASHSRFFWGLRLHLLSTLHGLPVALALTGAKADERQALLDILHADPALVADHPGQILIGDKNYDGHPIRGRTRRRRTAPAAPRPARVKPTVPAATSSNPSGRTSSRSSTRTRANSTSNNTAAEPQPVVVRVLQRILALTATIWHNDRTGQPVKRSLLAHDH